MGRKFLASESTWVYNGRNAGWKMLPLPSISSRGKHMPKEFELKYRADDAAIEAIRERYSDFQEFAMQTTYYGTADGALSRRRWTLRQRMENDISICTLKTPAGAYARNEFQVVAADILTAIPMLCSLGAPEELKELTKNGVTPICGAKFTRLAATITVDGSLLELALDRGYLTGGGKVLPIWEVEVELKEGSEETAVAFGEKLAEHFRLKAESRSKFARARALAALP